MIYKLKSVIRTDNKCTGTDSTELVYTNWTDGIETQKHLLIPTPTLIRFELTLLELNELNK